MTINYLLSYGAYLLGALIFILDQIKKYEDIANANPDPSITYKRLSFWRKERINIIQIVLYGIVSVIILPRMFGGTTIDFKTESGSVMYSLALKAALIPLQVIVGWSGGRVVLALMGKTKGELYKKVGITEDKP